MNKVFSALLAWSLMTLGTSAPSAAICPGDCGNDGRVTIEELIVGVNVVLGRAPAERCAAIDADGDGRVTVNEIVRAVAALLHGCPQARLIALSRGGRIASLEIAYPWTVRASDDLGAVISSARCRRERCLVVHPALDAISVVAAADLSVSAPIMLEHGAAPRDVALVDDHTVVVSQYGSAELVEIDLRTRATTPIDLTVLADADGLPEALMLAHCGRRVFAQLRRVDHDTDVPAAIGAVLAVIDLDRTGSERIIDADPDTPGVQGIALAGRPAFDMPVDCAAGVLYVAEPMPLMQGGGGYEQIDLDTLTAREFPIATGAEVGGFEVIAPNQYWLITHTDFGPGASSHLNFIGGAFPDTHNTFAGEHVNDLALDRDEDLLFFPDPCTPGPSNTTCDTGVHIFNAGTGARELLKAVNPGFAPIEVVVSR